MSFLEINSQNDVRKSYGWDVELTCSKCGFVGLPRYEGRSHSLKTKIPNVTVFAKVVCQACEHRLTDEAGAKLENLFRDVEIPEKNALIIAGFIAGLLGVPVLLAVVFFFGAMIELWGWGYASVILLVSAVSTPLLAFEKNRRIATLPQQCACGNPHHVYMGMLHGDHCYRCFSCGRLMKVRE